MLSKEEIEYLNDLEKALESNDSFYWQEDMYELINMLKNKDKKEQKLIEKLEEDIENNNFKETECLEDKGRYYYAKEILGILKGEKE